MTSMVCVVVTHPSTSITHEYPSAEGDPYYPVPNAANAALYARYEALADATEGVTFAGRLGTYRYHNMDQVVAQALATFERLVGRKRDHPAALSRAPSLAEARN